MLHRRVLVFVTWARACGLTRKEAAVCVGVADRSVAEWQRRWDDDRLAIEPLGRPVERATPLDRAAVFAFLEVSGVRTGLPALQGFFREIARAELAELRVRYRRVVRQRATVVIWTRPGAVWAIDHSQAPVAIDGSFRYYFAVRDLASGEELLVLPVHDVATGEALLAMRRLFACHGPPLVLKMDNGSAYISELFSALLDAHGVLPLYSPPGMPRYNGGREAGNGQINIRAHHHAASAGRPGHWTCDDIEAARRQANETGRPWGAHGPTPEEVWNARRPLEHELRLSLCARVHELEPAVRHEYRLPIEGELEAIKRREVLRVAVRRALREHDLLQYRRR